MQQTTQKLQKPLLPRSSHLALFCSLFCVFFNAAKKSFPNSGLIGAWREGEKKAREGERQSTASVFWTQPAHGKKKGKNFREHSPRSSPEKKCFGCVPSPMRIISYLLLARCPVAPSVPPPPRAVHYLSSPPQPGRWNTTKNVAPPLPTRGGEFVTIGLHFGDWNKNRLSSTTCGEELQKIFKDWQSFKGLYQKVPKRFSDFKQFVFLTFFDL